MKILLSDLTFAARFDKNSRKTMGQQDLGPDIPRCPKNRVSPSASQLKDEFLSLAAHEIRTPITVIKAQAQLAELFHAQGRFEGEIVEKCLKTFVRESDRLARICTDLLDVARIDNDTLEIRLSEFDLNELLEKLVFRLAPKQEQHRILLSCGPSPLVAFADRERVEQVLVNLISNAVRFSPQGGEIVLSASIDGDGHLAVSVKDDGIGIAPDKMRKIFERYYRAHQSGLKGPCGLGIGLYLSRELIRRMGGFIHAQSKGLGQGAEFVFKLRQGNIPMVDPAMTASLVKEGATHE